MSLRVVSYDAEQRTLRIQFDGGEVYDYYIVPPDVGQDAQTLLANGDTGFFRAHIRGVYPSTRVR